MYVFKHIFSSFNFSFLLCILSVATKSGLWLFTSSIHFMVNHCHSFLNVQCLYFHMHFIPRLPQVNNIYVTGPYPIAIWQRKYQCFPLLYEQYNLRIPLYKGLLDRCCYLWSKTQLVDDELLGREIGEQKLCPSLLPTVWAAGLPTKNRAIEPTDRTPKG